MRSKGPDVKEEVAAWDRDGLAVTTSALQTTTRVQLEWPADGETIICDQDGMGDNPWADEVVSLLRS